MRNVIIAGAVLLLAPFAVQAQAATSVAYRPNPVAARLQGDAARFQAAQDTVGPTVDRYTVDDSVVYGAAIGGLIGGLTVAIHTVTTDNQEEPLNWAVAVAAPIVGGLIGAGVGWLLR